MEIVEFLIYLLILIIGFVCWLFFFGPGTIRGGDGDKFRIIFIGTVPVKPTDESGFKQNDKSCNGMCRMSRINKFIEDHKDKIDYRFLIYDEDGSFNGSMHGVTIDERHRPFIINHDLRNGLPEGIGTFNIVYVDTNTFGYIDQNKNLYYWTDLFKPLMAEHSCMIFDDEDSTTHYTKAGHADFLGLEVYHEIALRPVLLEKYLSSTDRDHPGIMKHVFNSKNPILQDFLVNVVRHNKWPTFLIKVPKEFDGIKHKYGSSLKDLSGLNKFRQNWDI